MVPAPPAGADRPSGEGRPHEVIFDDHDAIVGVVLVVMTLWPQWRRMKTLERERDEKARDILERWHPAERREPS